MCMKYVNATVRCFDSAFIKDGKLISFTGPFDTIKAEKINGNVSIGGFVVLTEIAIMGTKNKNVDTNPINKHAHLHFTVRLTKCDKDSEKQKCVDLDCFDVNIEELDAENKLSKACYSFYNKMNITKVKEIILPFFDDGRYVIKVLVNETKDSNEDIIQSMTPLYVSCAE